MVGDVGLEPTIYVLQWFTVIILRSRFKSVALSRSRTYNYRDQPIVKEPYDPPNFYIVTRDFHIDDHVFI